MKREESLLFSGRILLCVLAVLFSLISFRGPAVAEEPEKNGILAIGTARMSQGNVAEARKRALSAALGRGVEEYLLRRLGGQALANQLSVFVEELVPAAREEVANFNIVGEEETGEHYRVLVSVRINEATLERVLEEKGFLREEGPPVKVLFMVSNREPGAEGPVYWWKSPEEDRGLLPMELALHRAFEERGFSLASRTLKVPEGEEEEALRKPDLTPEQAAEWGRVCSAEVVVIGSSLQSEGMISIYLRALDAATAAPLAEQGAQVRLDDSLSGQDRIQDGIERAVQRVSERLAPVVQEAFQRVEGEVDRFHLTLQGLGSFQQLKRFTQYLKEHIPGVESLSQTRFKGDSVTLAVGYREGVDHFLEVLRAREDMPFFAEFRKMGEGEVVVTLR